jgi:ribonuclease HI
MDRISQIIQQSGEIDARELHVYTDGSYYRKIGAWSFCVCTSKSTHDLIYGHCNWVKDTTIQRMEMLAILNSANEVLSKFILLENLVVYTDSAYVANAIYLQWPINWVSNSWKTSTGEDVKNRDLWEMFFDLDTRLRKRGVTMRVIKVKAHSGIPGNEYVDYLANKARRSQSNVVETKTKANEFFSSYKKTARSN